MEPSRILVLTGPAIATWLEGGLHQARINPHLAAC
jgi:hypothetical protein